MLPLYFSLAAPAGLEPAIPYGILINSQAFYQLNYRAIKQDDFFDYNGALPIELIPEMVGDEGLEPPTPGS